MEVLANHIHYMIVPYPTEGLRRSDWTIALFKDGQLAPEIPVEVEERTATIYVFEFVNDGTDKSLWTLVVAPPDRTGQYYTESWTVRKNIVEQSLSEMRVGVVSEAGSFMKPKI